MTTLQSIRQRQTFKMLSEKPLPTTPADTQLIEQLLEAAYWAPFHYPAHIDHKNELDAELPFRFYVLDSANCRALAKKLQDENIEANKLIPMLHSADYLLQATWTPQPYNGDELFEPSPKNMEHIAAAGAAIQNLLLTATALGRHNYWGSGGVLRQDFAFDWLGMPKTEILLGALFIFPDEDDITQSVQLKTSPKRDKRGDLKGCYRWVSV